MTRKGNNRPISLVNVIAKILNNSSKCQQTPENSGRIANYDPVRSTNYARMQELYNLLRFINVKHCDSKVKENNNLIILVAEENKMTL